MIGPRTYPRPRNILNIPDEMSFISGPCSSGYLSSTDSIISGKDGIKINGSTKPLNAWPKMSIKRVFWKSKSSEGPTNKFVKKDKKHAKIIIARF